MVVLCVAVAAAAVPPVKERDEERDDGTIAAFRPVLLLGFDPTVTAPDDVGRPRTVQPWLE